jgi:hypothetical protein
MAAGRHPAEGEAVPPTYTSEMHVPIREQDPRSFDERQHTIWDQMHERMERRRREWDDEVRSSVWDSVA